MTPGLVCLTLMLNTGLAYFIKRNNTSVTHLKVPGGLYLQNKTLHSHAQYRSANIIKT